MATSQPQQQQNTNAPKGNRYRALTPIEHDGKSYAVDKILTLDEDAAKPLLAVGAIEAAKATKEEAAS